MWVLHRYLSLFRSATMWWYKMHWDLVWVPSTLCSFLFLCYIGVTETLHHWKDGNKTKVYPIKCESSPIHLPRSSSHLPTDLIPEENTVNCLTHTHKSFLCVFTYIHDKWKQFFHEWALTMCGRYNCVNTENYLPHSFQCQCGIP